MSRLNDNGDAAVLAQEVVYRYPDGTLALDHLSLRIAVGETVCLAGPNGAGKSTLLLALAGLVPAAGTILVDGRPPDTNAALGLVFQDPDDQLFCSSLYEDVAFGPRNQGCAADEVARRVAAALEAAELVGYESRHAHHLSGGEKKRAAIAAALACRPQILALDEPWANLDARGARAVNTMIGQFPGTCIVSSQDLYRAAEVCERCIVMDAGAVRADGETANLLQDADLLARHGLEFGHRCRYCPEATGRGIEHEPEAGS